MKTDVETSAQIARFKEKNGRQWKAKLREAWFSGVYPSTTDKEDIPFLQKLRNQIGVI